MRPRSSSEILDLAATRLIPSSRLGTSQDAVDNIWLIPMLQYQVPQKPGKNFQPAQERVLAVPMAGWCWSGNGLRPGFTRAGAVRSDAPRNRVLWLPLTKYVPAFEPSGSAVRTASGTRRRGGWFPGAQGAGTRAGRIPYDPICLNAIGRRPAPSVVCGHDRDGGD